MSEIGNNIFIFETADGSVQLPVNVGEETVWLNRNQMSELFGCDIKTIGKHINNAIPNRLSLLGLIEYCIVALISVWYGVGIIGYFFFQNYHNFLIPFTVILLMCQAVIFFILINWNRWRVHTEDEVISKVEMKRRKKECQHENYKD